MQLHLYGCMQCFWNESTKTLAIKLNNERCNYIYLNR